MLSDNLKMQPFENAPESVCPKFVVNCNSQQVLSMWCVHTKSDKIRPFSIFNKHTDFECAVDGH